MRGFAAGSDGKESTCHLGDPGSILELGRPLVDENRYPLQYSCLENSMDRGACVLYSSWGCTESDITE